MKAKDASLWAKILAASIVIGSLIAKMFGAQVSIDDAIKAAGAVYLFFAPVDVNIALDKIFPTRKAE